MRNKRVLRRLKKTGRQKLIHSKVIVYPYEDEERRRIEKLWEESLSLKQKKTT